MSRWLARCCSDVQTRFSREGDQVLVLTRVTDEDIMVGNDIRIKVVAVNGSQVRLGIEAPGHITILRGEIADEVARQNEAAAAAALGVLRHLAERDEPPG
jgi:carbon storage regulator